MRERFDWTVALLTATAIVLASMGFSLIVFSPVGDTRAGTVGALILFCSIFPAGCAADLLIRKDDTP